nr:uncharacterized protein LOC109162273 [Ipomoea batatas]
MDHPIKFQFFKDIMAFVRRPGRGVTFTDLKNNHFLLCFYYEVDYRFWDGRGPWSYEQYLLVLHCLKDGETPMVVCMLNADFWVKVHDFPSDSMSTKVAEGIGNSIGVVSAGG